MKNFFYILTIIFFFSSCFRTKTETEEDILKAKIRDSLYADSVTKRRNTPDTAIATFKRTAYCDGKLMVVFDRVKVLSGEEAAEYALRHKRFGNNVNVVVNQEVSLETLPMDENAPVFIYDKIPDDSIPGKFHYGYKKENFRAVADFEFEQVMEIIILHRSIIYVKQREL